jgi:hypothetical protein
VFHNKFYFLRFTLRRLGLRLGLRFTLRLALRLGLREFARGGAERLIVRPNFRDVLDIAPLKLGEDHNNHLDQKFLYQISSNFHVLYDEHHNALCVLYPYVSYSLNSQ